MSFILGTKSLAALEGVHPDLVRVVKCAIVITKQDFSVSEGLRTRAKQAEYLASGASKTMDSRHLTGHAVDLHPYIPGLKSLDSPQGINGYWRISTAMYRAADAERVAIDWGFDLWGWDMPHYELPRSRYP